MFSLKKLHLYSLSINWLGNKRKDATILKNLFAGSRELSVPNIYVYMYMANSLAEKYHYY